MPTNVSPEYKKAEAAFRQTREPTERLEHLREMLKTIPKHKGTEHLQADIKTRIKELTAEVSGPQKGAARTGPTRVIRTEGAAQVALVGPPNAGKSLLHSRLTGSRAESAPYPHTTNEPLPGMLMHNEVQFQLVDLPPISAELMEPWLPNAMQPAHAALLVIDLHVPGCTEDVISIRERLAEKRIILSDDWRGRLPGGLVEGLPGTEPVGSAPPEPEQPGDEADETIFHTVLPTLLVVNKVDLGLDPDEVTALEELVEARYPAIAVSAATGEGLDRLGSMLRRGLDVVRVYTKVPGKPPDMERPFTLFRGDRVIDVARLVHRGRAAGLKFARIWGSGKFDGQQVGRDYLVEDGDILELHM
ncbi:50S ribosome-binding GTPase [bacterium]|nr:50S ribosome-binding GTPase [bacterium]MBU1495087.1 50S ribosome-binding GTPase [Actinomycetota bacterium]MBU1676831.1 50S ribosome-binding GTPase [bacterium]